MIKLITVLTLLTGACFAQGGNTVTITSSGAPTGACSYIFQYIDSATGNQYNCKAGAWNQIGGGGGSTAFSAITGATNTSAAMIVGSGASLGTSGTGTITATNVAMVQIETHAASASATLNFTTCFAGSTYHTYIIELRNLVPATNAQTLLMRVSTNGGSTYDSAGNYMWGGFRWASNGSAFNLGSDTDTSFGLSGASGVSSTASLGGLSATIKVIDPLNGTQRTAVSEEHVSLNDGSRSVGVGLAGEYATTTAVNAFQFLFASGNITSGTGTCYGVTP